MVIKALVRYTEWVLGEAVETGEIQRSVIKRMQYADAPGSGDGDIIFLARVCGSERRNIE